MTNPHADPLVCHRCGALLAPGTGTAYIVRIEAFADPTPPGDDLEASADAAAEIDRLLAQMRERSARELMDDVHRRVTVHLCRACYLTWIEDPVGAIGASRSRPDSAG